MSGGASSLTEAPIDVAALERDVAGPGMGAIVTFVGRARDAADDGRTVVELEYEAYAEMAGAVLDEIRCRGRAAIRRGRAPWSIGPAWCRSARRRWRS